MKIPVTILKGFEIDLWQSNRRKVVKDPPRGYKIDGICPVRLYNSGYMATINPDYFKNFKRYT